MFGLGFLRPRSDRPAQAAPERAAEPCFHCGLPLPEPVADWVEFEGRARPMCCASCRAAAELVIGNGFGAYYHRRAAKAA